MYAIESPKIQPIILTILQQSYAVEPPEIKQARLTILQQLSAVKSPESQQARLTVLQQLHAKPCYAYTLQNANTPQDANAIQNTIYLWQLHELIIAFGKIGSEVLKDMQLSEYINSSVLPKFSNIRSMNVYFPNQKPYFFLVFKEKLEFIFLRFKELKEKHLLSSAHITAYKDLIFGLGTCPTGIGARLQEIERSFAYENVIALDVNKEILKVLTDFRSTILKIAAAKFVANNKAHIIPGMEIHVEHFFYDVAKSQNLGIEISGLLEVTKDTSRSHLKIDLSMARNFFINQFHTQYSIINILGIIIQYYKDQLQNYVKHETLHKPVILSCLERHFVDTHIIEGIESIFNLDDNGEQSINPDFWNNLPKYCLALLKKAGFLNMDENTSSAFSETLPTIFPNDRPGILNEEILQHIILFKGDDHLIPHLPFIAKLNPAILQRIIPLLPKSHILDLDLNIFPQFLSIISDNYLQAPNEIIAKIKQMEANLAGNDQIKIKLILLMSTRSILYTFSENTMLEQINSLSLDINNLIISFLNYSSTNAATLMEENNISFCVALIEYIKYLSPDLQEQAYNYLESIAKHLFFAKKIKDSHDICKGLSQLDIATDKTLVNYLTCCSFVEAQLLLDELDINTAINFFDRITHLSDELQKHAILCLGNIASSLFNIQEIKKSLEINKKLIELDLTKDPYNYLLCCSKIEDTPLEETDINICLKLLDRIMRLSPDSQRQNITLLEEIAGNLFKAKKFKESFAIYRAYFNINFIKDPFIFNYLLCCSHLNAQLLEEMDVNNYLISLGRIKCFPQKFRQPSISLLGKIAENLFNVKKIKESFVIYRELIQSGAATHQIVFNYLMCCSRMEAQSLDEIDIKTCIKLLNEIKNFPQELQQHILFYLKKIAIDLFCINEFKKSLPIYRALISLNELTDYAIMDYLKCCSCEKAQPLEEIDISNCLRLLDKNKIANLSLDLKQPAMRSLTDIASSLFKIRKFENSFAIYKGLIKSGFTAFWITPKLKPIMNNIIVDFLANYEKCYNNQPLEEIIINKPVELLQRIPYLPDDFKQRAINSLRKLAEKLNAAGKLEESTLISDKLKEFENEHKHKTIPVHSNTSTTASSVTHNSTNSTLSVEKPLISPLITAPIASICSHKFKYTTLAELTSYKITELLHNELVDTEFLGDNIEDIEFRRHPDQVNLGNVVYFNTQHSSTRAHAAFVRKIIKNDMGYNPGLIQKYKDNIPFRCTGSACFIAKENLIELIRNILLNTKISEERKLKLQNMISSLEKEGGEYTTQDINLGRTYAVAIPKPTPQQPLQPQSASSVSSCAVTSTGNKFTLFAANTTHTSEPDTDTARKRPHSRPASDETLHSNNKKPRTTVPQHCRLFSATAQTSPPIFDIKAFDVPYTIGDCLFTAIATQVGYETNQLRQTTVNRIEHSPDLLEKIDAIIGPKDEKIDKNLTTASGRIRYNNQQEYLTLMRQPGTWGTEIELTAISRELQRPIFIVNRTPGQKETAHIISEQIHAEGNPIFLEYTGNHYRPCEAPKNIDQRKAIFQQLKLQAELNQALQETLRSNSV